MNFINITPTNLIGKVGNKIEMALTHLMLNNEDYRLAMSTVTTPIILDNSYFELGYCLSPSAMLEAARNFVSNDVTLICPDGTMDGMQEFKEAGYKVMCIPKSIEQFQDMMYDNRIDLVGVSEEHFDKRHSVGARYNLFKDHMPAMAQKKIHMLGGTDTMKELLLVAPFSKYIHSWDTSMPVWQGHLGHKLDTQVSKDVTGVDFDVKVSLQNPIVKHNITWVQDVLDCYYEN